jgi:hypothetical protein
MHIEHLFYFTRNEVPNEYGGQGKMVSWNENAKSEQTIRGQRNRQPVRKKDAGSGARLVPSVPLRRPAR